MRTLSAVCTTLITTLFIVSAQSNSIRIAGINEPPELTGEPKKFIKPPEALRELADVFPTNEKDADKARLGIEKVSRVLQQHPDYSDGFLMRALFSRCMLNSTDTDSLLRDIDTSILTHAGQPFPTAYETLADHYSLRAKIKLDNGRYREAVDDLEAAMRQKIENAAYIFNSNGVEPDTVSSPCAWTTSDLDILARKFPKDYRTRLFRGLYTRFFLTFDEKYFQLALREFQQAVVLNPQSALPHYYIGDLYGRAWFLTNTTDETRNDNYRKSIQEYNKAIQLDSRLLQAYELRASAYRHLNQYPQAIKDWTKVLELDPENVSAYSDRGLANLELGQYPSAVIDFGRAITRMKPDDRTLDSAYENRAEAYLKLGDFQNAIADLSKAIERRLSNDTFLFSLQQIRGLYPEYNNVSDETLCRKINALFWPQFAYDVLAKRLMQENGKWQISLLHPLYEKRGDAYLRANNFRRGVLDFDRIYKGIPNFARSVDRWRQLGSSPGEEYYLDVKTVEFNGNEFSRLWVKTLNKMPKPMSTVQGLELDCKSRRLNVISVVRYDADDHLIDSSDVSGGWRRVVPGTTGEQLYNGMCSAQQ